jgi:hypothetical protein
VASATKKSERTHSLSKTTSGPSRIQNERQQKIVRIVDGYDSTVSISAGLRNVLLVWVLPGLAMTFLGLGGIFAAGGGSLVRTSFTELVFAIRVGTGLLSMLTVIVSIVWSVRTWGNIRRLGKRAKIGVWDVLKRHGLFFVASPVLLILGVFVNPVLFIMGLIALYLAFSVGPFLVLAVIRLFWRTGSPPIGLEEELPHYGIVWFTSWWIYTSLAGLGEFEELSLRAASMITAAAGVSCVVAAITAAKLVTDISRRHDERLAAIVSSVELDTEDEQQEVTSQQIESAWAVSETLVSFDGH